MKNEVVIKVESVSKTFNLPHERLSTAKQRFTNIFARKSYEQFHALDNVSFEVKKGEFFGIIGSNGSGKSTMLKILAKIYQPTSGRIEITERVSPFIELGVGFNPELTARENVFLNAAILGLSKKETEDKFDQIIDFAELHTFVDQKLKNFSSGMQVRLAFSIAIQAQAGILLIDEVLAVGDAAFQQKCFDVFRKLKAEKKTIVFVSHALNVIEEFCDRVIVLQKGKIIFSGQPSEGIVGYLRGEVTKSSRTGSSDFKASSNKDIQVKRIEFINEKGESKGLIGTGDCLTIRTYFKASKKVNQPIVGLAIYREDGVHITGPNTKTSHFQIGTLFGEGSIDYRIDNVPLLAGNYLVTIGIFDKDMSFAYDFIDKGAAFTVAPNYENQFGLISSKGIWSLNGKK